MADVVVEGRTERLDLGLPDADLLGADSELEEAVREVADEEDHGIADERDCAERHEPDAHPERRRLLPIRAGCDTGHPTSLLSLRRVCPGKTLGEICYCIGRGSQ